MDSEKAAEALARLKRFARADEETNRYDARLVQEMQQQQAQQQQTQQQLLQGQVSQQNVVQEMIQQQAQQQQIQQQVLQGQVSQQNALAQVLSALQNSASPETEQIRPTQRQRTEGPGGVDESKMDHEGVRSG